MNIERYLAGIKNSVDKKLKKYLASKDKASHKIDACMRYGVLSKGKRIRPILAIEACRACGGDVNRAMTAACAIELVHSYSLIHDDLPIMDDDDYRRGRPTCHRVFGEANAILAGDALIPLAFNIIAKELPPKVSSRIAEELSNAIGARGMVLGQALDLEYKGKKRTRQILTQINALKTSRLFEASTKLGAIAANAPKKEIEAMARFGRCFGLSFQLIDDILDNDDYAKLLGVEKAKADAKDLINKAKRSLKMFGNRATRLENIADFILTRKI